MGHSKGFKWQRKNFFISYNHKDEKWATWIAFTLEQAGYTVIVQAWDFRPGANFVMEMDSASKEAERTIAVLSADYLSSSFTSPEWAAAFAGDPTGAAHGLIPVRVRDCDVSGLLGQIIYIDLVGLNDQDATAALLAGIEPGRAKPLTRPAFPGAVPEQATPGPSRPARPKWRVLQSPLEVIWRQDSDRSSYGPSVMELHLIPASPIRIESRRLATLRDELILAGRQHGLFSLSQAVNRNSTEATVTVSVDDGRDSIAGLMVVRSGQRSAWATLPHDMMGSVLDSNEATARVAAMLDVLFSLDLEFSDEVGFSIGVAPVGMMMVGDASMVGRRSSASLPMTSVHEVRVEADDVIPLDAARAATKPVAEELVTRLIAKMPRGLG